MSNMTPAKPREFIAYKRTAKSSWIYDEYSDQTSKAIDEIAPECGNFCKLVLIDKTAFETAVEALKKSQKELRRLNCDAPLELTIETGKVCLEIDKALKELGIEV